MQHHSYNQITYDNSFLTKKHLRNESTDFMTERNNDRGTSHSAPRPLFTRCPCTLSPLSHLKKIYKLFHPRIPNYLSYLLILATSAQTEIPVSNNRLLLTWSTSVTLSLKVYLKKNYHALNEDWDTSLKEDSWINNKMICTKIPNSVGIITHLSRSRALISITEFTASKRRKRKRWGCVLGLFAFAASSHCFPIGNSTSPATEPAALITCNWIWNWYDDIWILPFTRQ